MNKKNHYINLFVLACMMLLAITSCQQELMPVQPQEDSARTLTFTLNMPQGKPAFGEGQSRAATTGTWAEGDELLMTITADEYMIQYLTLQHNASGTWDVLTGKSYTHFTQDNSYAPYSEMPMLTQTTGLSLSGGTWTVRADEAWPENLPMSVQLVYAPDMEFDAEGGLALKADATTSLPEYWEAASTENTAGTLSLQWAQQTNARLRIYTGMAGDEVKLTSEAISAKFTCADHTYTATTQADGYACFYCTTTGTAPLTSGFKVELTGLKGMTLPTPETLLEATPLVSVLLDYGKSYKLDAEDKRQKVVDNFIVIDGCATDVDAVKAAFRTGYAAGKRTLVVEGTKLAEYTGVINNVVGMAIANSYVENGSLSLLMPNVASVPDVAFQHRDVLKSVSAPSATLIGNSAFDRCAFLTTAFFPAATSIGTRAFYDCTSLEDISFPAVVSIGEHAFYICGNLTNASFPVATLIGKSAFDRCASLKSAFFPAATSIGSNAFYECMSLEDISFPAVVSIGRQAFHECSSLTTASFPAAESIEQSAFYSCDDLTTASFPSATLIGESAFQRCPSLTTVSFPAAESVGNYVFGECSSLTSASFPCATSIGRNAFYLCYALASASFPLARSIGEKAFYVCRKLATLSFGSVITSVGNEAFSTVGSEVGGCDLHLAEEQGGVVEGDDIQQGIWGGEKHWKSITVGGVKIYPAANGN